MPTFFVGRERAAGGLADQRAPRRTPCMWPRGMPRPVSSRPRSVRRGPAAFSASSASRPQNAGLDQPTAQPDAGLHRA